MYILNLHTTYQNSAESSLPSMAGWNARWGCVRKSLFLQCASEQQLTFFFKPGKCDSCGWSFSFAMHMLRLPDVTQISCPHSAHHSTTHTLIAQNYACLMEVIFGITLWYFSCNVEHMFTVVAKMVRNKKTFSTRLSICSFNLDFIFTWMFINMLWTICT